MGRWQPDARGRLEQAAYELFRDQGYDRTTVAEISARAGLTERTFFRHYADKREVLFGGAAFLEAELVRALDSLPKGGSAMDAMRIAVETIAGHMRGRRDLARERRAIIAAHPELQERDHAKRAALTRALAEAMRRRGMPEPEASLNADVAVAVFYVAFSRWLDEAQQRDLVEIVREGFDHIAALGSGSRPRRKTPSP
ncbi:MAG TPA: TetR family transcriptional regulator [Candidatus Baltobacteraceae bacterium]|nr:TetR family transcriptional regulator [Candidatus Baltobacteraceae bacterium]